MCEAIATSAKQRMLNDHNALHGDNGNGNNSITNAKPAERCARAKKELCYILI